jgi:hypothetical protein
LRELISGGEFLAAVARLAELLREDFCEQRATFVAVLCGDGFLGLSGIGMRSASTS